MRRGPGPGWLFVVAAALLSASCRVSPSHRCETTLDCISGVCVSGLCLPPRAGDAEVMEVSAPDGAADAGDGRMDAGDGRMDLGSGSADVGNGSADAGSPDAPADAGSPDAPVDGGASDAPPDVGLSDALDGADPGGFDAGDRGDVPGDGGGDAPPPIDITWATWPMPNPPFLGFDTRTATGLPNPQSYDYLSDPAVVYDGVTGLVWQRDMTDATFNLFQAREQCAGLTLDGHDDWRLPSRIELTSIIDYTAIRTTLVDLSAFPGAVDGIYWTNSPSQNPSVFWNIDFSTAAVNTEFQMGVHLVRCVRRPTPQGPLPPHYDFSQPGTVRDNWTGLTWQRTAAPDLMNGNAAVSYCGAVTPAGEWRLPTLKELETLVPEHSFASFDVDVFPEPDFIPIDAGQATFWTSSWWDNNWMWAFAVGIGGSSSHVPMDTTLIRARCVR